MVVPSSPGGVHVGEARIDEFDRIAQLTTDVYRVAGLASADYLSELADVAGRATRSQLLGARDDSGTVVGSVALVLEGDFGEITEGEDEAAFRMLVVGPAARGGGVGELLVRTCLARARGVGKRRMVLSTGGGMTAARRLYRRLGFDRLPERDWSPVPGVDLVVYALEL